MIKKILGAVVGAALVGLIIYGGVTFVAARQNTADRVAQVLVSDLAAGKTNSTYERLRSELTKDREAYWHEYLMQLAAQQGTPVLVMAEQISDTFHAYPDGSEPERFVYELQLKDAKTYRLSMVLFKIHNAWVVDDLSGTPVH